MQVTDTLAERGARYGKFIEHSEIAQGIQAVMAKGKNWSTLDYDMRQALCVISDKIARILNGDPYYDDNWHDIQGYAKLVEDRIKALPSNDTVPLIEPEPIKTSFEPWIHGDITTINGGSIAGDAIQLRRVETHGNTFVDTKSPSVSELLNTYKPHTPLKDSVP